MVEMNLSGISLSSSLELMESIIARCPYSVISVVGTLAVSMNLDSSNLMLCLGKAT